jgi:hypothetical protein
MAVALAIEIGQTRRVDVAGIIVKIGNIEQARHERQDGNGAQPRKVQSNAQAKIAQLRVRREIGFVQGRCPLPFARFGAIQLLQLLQSLAKNPGTAANKSLLKMNDSIGTRENQCATLE